MLTRSKCSFFMFFLLVGSGAMAVESDSFVSVGSVDDAIEFTVVSDGRTTRNDFALDVTRDQGVIANLTLKRLTPLSDNKMLHKNIAITFRRFDVGIKENDVVRINHNEGQRLKSKRFICYSEKLVIQAHLSPSKYLSIRGDITFTADSAQISTLLTDEKTILSAPVTSENTLKIYKLSFDNKIRCFSEFAARLRVEHYFLVVGATIDHDPNRRPLTKSFDLMCYDGL